MKSVVGQAGLSRLFEFVWLVDEDGYEIRSGRPDGVSLDGVVRRYRQGPWLARKGGALRRSRLLADHPEMSAEFASLLDAGRVSGDAIIRFAGEYGFLRHWPGPDADCDAESLQYWGDSIWRVSEFLKMADQNPVDAVSLAGWFNCYMQPISRMHLTAAQKDVSLQFNPLCLWDAICVQMAALVDQSVGVKKCKNCGGWIQYGQGTGHTRRKDFCSDRCRVAWNRSKAKGAVS